MYKVLRITRTNFTDMLNVINQIKTDMSSNGFSFNSEDYNLINNGSIYILEVNVRA